MWTTQYTVQYTILDMGWWIKIILDKLTKKKIHMQAYTVKREWQSINGLHATFMKKKEMQTVNHFINVRKIFHIALNGTFCNAN